MKKLYKNTVIFQLVVQDFQDLAQDRYNRKLTNKEIGMVQRIIDKHFEWYDQAGYILDDVIDQSKE